jgi:hypothetical protein
VFGYLEMGYKSTIDSTIKLLKINKNAMTPEFSEAPNSQDSELHPIEV